MLTRANRSLSRRTCRPVSFEKCRKSLVGSDTNGRRTPSKQYIRRTGNDAITAWAEARLIFGRGRATADGEDILRVAIASSNQRSRSCESSRSEFELRD